MIRLQQVNKIYPRAEGPITALCDVTLEVPRGEFVAIRGPSGCGKSTLLTIIGGLGAPTSGEVHVAGEDLRRMNSASRAAFRARHVGFVFQMFHLLPYLTVVENVAAAALDHGRDRAVELLEQFGLGDRLTHRPAELSAGQRQRVAIARALVNRPALVLADEPTGNLDPESAAEVMRLLAHYHAAGNTVLLVTHQELAEDLVDRTVFMDRGQLRAAPSSRPPAGLPAT